MIPTISHFRVMWIFVLFDLPTETAQQRKNYAKFRKELLKQGFTMQQFSVYTLFCGSKERMESRIDRVKRILPAEGHVIILHLTDKQYGMIMSFYCRYEQMLKAGPEQLELF